MTITHYLLLFLFNSLWIFGVYELCSVDFLDDDYPEHGINEDTKGLFWKVKQFSILHFGWFYSKPICLCPPCMASLHSLYIFFAAQYLFDTITPLDGLIWLFYAVCLVGFNSLIVNRKIPISWDFLKDCFRNKNRRTS